MEGRFGTVAVRWRPAGVQCDHSSEPASVLGRDPGREHSHCFELVGLEGRSERDRAIVVQGEPVNHVLGVVLGASRVQDCIGL